MKELKKFQRGIAFFNARKFFEAHEVWEELWLLEPEPERTFLQGLIQLAAAFHHYGRGNRRGARSLLAAGIVKLDRFPKDHDGVALTRLRAEAEDWVRAFNEGTDPGLRKPPEIHLPVAAGTKGRRAPPRGNASKRRTRPSGWKSRGC